MDILPEDARKIRIEFSDYGALSFRSLIAIPDQAAIPRGMVGRNIFTGKKLDVLWQSGHIGNNSQGQKESSFAG
ncbi:MAG: hypothetical protein ACOYOS_24200 [Syntrophales bacterium]